MNVKKCSFWVGLLLCIILIGKSAQYGFWSFSVLLAYIIGYNINGLYNYFIKKVNKSENIHSRRN